MSTAPTGVVTDFSGYTELRAKARNDDPEALRAAAKQFEALFTQMLLKSMRDASLGENLMDGEQSGMYRDLFDQQLALSMAQGKGLGLADVLVRQLGGRPDASRGPASSETLDPGVRRDDFIAKVLPHAQAAAQKLGVAPEALVAQSALETGWGKSLPAASQNYFGIKATGEEPAARSTTHEYVDGARRSEVAAFRAYRSAAASFDDYAKLVGTAPRYAEALGAGADVARYAQALQDGGYATDPAYADKVAAIANDPDFRARIAAAARRLGEV